MTGAARVRRQLRTVIAQAADWRAAAGDSWQTDKEGLGLGFGLGLGLGLMTHTSVSTGWPLGLRKSCQND